MCSPLISMFSQLMQMPKLDQPKLRFLYSTKVDSGRPIDGSRILFLPRLMEYIQDLTSSSTDIKVRLFITGIEEAALEGATQIPDKAKAGRITAEELDQALGRDVKWRKNVVCYVCGPPQMTDEIVEYLSTQPGMAKSRVFCEKWW